MNKKILALALVTTFFITGFITTPAQSITNINSNHEITLQNYNSNHSQDTKLSESTITEILNSITIGEIIELIKHNLQDKIHESPYKTMMMESIEDGVQTIGQLGLTSKMTLLEANDILGNGLLKIGKTKYRSFLINILPFQATVSTLIPPFEINLSENDQYESLSLKLELFIKVVPFIDRITTRQFGVVLPRLTQSAVIWPAVGGRITYAGFTLFIIAFGPRIRWTRA